MSRHAYNYWIKLQASKAVEEVIDAEETGMAETLREIYEGVHVRGLELEEIREEYDTAIAEAANALIKCELLHREIVRRGGRPNS